MSGSKVRRGVVGFVFAVTVLAAGCSERAPVAGPSSAGSPSLAPDAKPTGVVTGCTLAGSTGFVVPVPGGVPVEAMSVGAGTFAVVLSHEWGQSPCLWADVATRVAATGRRAVIWDYGVLTGLDRVRELQAVVDRLRADGAAKVVLAGGSIGGCLSMISASEIKPPVEGIAVLSCAVWYDVEHHIPTTEYAAKVTVPILYAVGELDDPALVAGVRTDFAAVPARDRKLLVVPDSPAHGVELFNDPSGGPQLWQAFLELLHRAAG